MVKRFFKLLLLKISASILKLNIFLNLVPELPYKSLHDDSEDYTI